MKHEKVERLTRKLHKRWIAAFSELQEIQSEAPLLFDKLSPAQKKSMSAEWLDRLNQCNLDDLEDLTRSLDFPNFENKERSYP